jgi:galactose mutarotase-like enzyme
MRPRLNPTVVLPPEASEGLVALCGLDEPSTARVEGNRGRIGLVIEGASDILVWAPARRPSFAIEPMTTPPTAIADAAIAEGLRLRPRQTRKLRLEMWLI